MRAEDSSHCTPAGESDPLRESPECHRLAAETVGVGSYDLDLESGEVHWSAELTALLGCQPGVSAELGNGGGPGWVHPDDRGRVAAALRSAEDPSGSGLLEEEFRILRPDGEIRWILDKGRVLFAGEGRHRRPVRRIGVRLDITHRRETGDRSQDNCGLRAATSQAATGDAAAPRRAEEIRARLAAIVETSSDAIICTDLEGRITFWNGGAEQLYGYREEEVLGELASVIYPEGYIEEPLELLARLRSGERIPAFDTVRKSRSGSLVHVSVAITPILASDGQVIGIAAVARDISHRKRMEEQLERDAFQDRLTELPNRALFADRLEHVMARAERFREPYALLLMDVDNFKLVNDTLGHLMGDRLLCQFAQRIRQALRPVDTLARFGGDEFTVLVEEVGDESGAARVAERILSALRAPFVLGEHVIHVRSSIGIALGRRSYRHPDDVLRDADIALYEAKRRGKAQYAFFSVAMRDEVTSRVHLETELRRALERRALNVAFQPVTDLRTEEIVGCEALARWDHPVLGLVEPSRFIALAEETGLIVPLGRFVLDRACAALAEWLRNPRVSEGFYVSVNLSPREFLQGDLVGNVAETLERYGLEGRNLRLEITENIIIAHEQSALAKLVALQKLGVHVCMDDFGTGYSSLGHLHQFPVDVLKMDRSFINALAERQRSREVVRAIADLAGRLGIQAIAEGVETDRQLRWLRDLGFRWIQGFVLHRPMDRGAMNALIAGTGRGEVG